MGEKGKVSSFLDFFKLGEDDDYDDFYNDDYDSDLDEKELRKEEKRLKK